MPVSPASIREIDLFSALGSADLARVASFMREHQIPRKGVILLEGARGDGFYYVQSGLVKVYRASAAGREQVLRLLGSGETFNDVPALDGGRIRPAPPRWSRALSISSARNSFIASSGSIQR